MNYIAQIKEINEYDFGSVSSHVYVPFFTWLKFNFISDRFFCRLLLPNTIRYHLPARLLTFRLLVKFSWLVFTGTVNLYSIANGIHIHNSWTRKSFGRFEQFLGCIWWCFGLTIHRLLYLTFLSVPRGSHWYLKARPIPSPSTLFKIQKFWLHSFLCVL